MDQFDFNEAYDTDDELVEKFDGLVKCYMMMFATMSLWESFNANELEEGGNTSVSLHVGVKKKLGNMQFLPTLFSTKF